MLRTSLRKLTNYDDIGIAASLSFSSQLIIQLTTWAATENFTQKKTP
jgi:hypothetical protein